MKPTIEQLKTLGEQNQSITIVFNDGCVIDVTVVETMHLDEGGDFAADVLAVRCAHNVHRHPRIGDCINIHLKDIRALRQLASTRCSKCGYILKGISEPRCPECGEKMAYD